MKEVVIIDTRCANIASVQHAFERLGCRVYLTQTTKDIQQAERIVFPGVGHAAYAMRTLREVGIVSILPTLQQPLLGICLGMQILAKNTDEGPTETLGVLAETVRPLPRTKRSPHMGWDQVFYQENATPLFEGIKNGAYFYFVHSYALPICQSTVAWCDYGRHFSAVVKHNNFWGVQFHPEKSAENGRRMLSNFLELRT